MLAVRLIVFAVFIVMVMVMRFGAHALVDTIGAETVFMIGIPLMCWGFWHEWKARKRARLND